MAKYKHSEICSFCGRELEAAGLKYIPGYNSNICSDCLTNGYEMIKQISKSESKNLSLGDAELAKPKEIKASVINEKCSSFEKCSNTDFIKEGIVIEIPLTYENSILKNSIQKVLKK